MRRERRFQHVPPPLSITQVNTVLADLERSLFDAYLHFHQDSSSRSCTQAESISAIEILKFFRVAPNSLTAPFTITSPYYSTIIDFIRFHEASPDPPNDDVLLQLALSHLALGDTFRAFHYISQRAPDRSPESDFVIGFCSTAFSRWSTALPILDSSKRSPDPLIVFHSFLCSAICHLKLEHFEAARLEFEALTQFAHPCFTPQDLDFHIAVCHFFANNRTPYREILGRLECDRVLEQQIYLEALVGAFETADYYGSKLKGSSLTYDLVILSAFVRYRQKKYREAVESLHRIFKGEIEKNYAVWLLLGMIQFAEAVAAITPNMPRSGNWFGEAATILNNANALRPGVPTIEWNLGVVLERSNRWDEAEIVYRKMVEGDRRAVYANLRIQQMAACKARSGEYIPPEMEEITLGIILRSPAEQKLTQFISGPVLFARETMALLGDIEPEVTEAHWNLSLVPDVGMAEDAGQEVRLVRS
jgi:tetratricopeptide (TPR) repeat protein